MKDYLLSPSFKSHLENAYFIAGILISIAALVGLLQLVLTRRIAKASALREAYRLAADKCETFATGIIPSYSNTLNELEAKNIKFLDTVKVTEFEGRFHFDLSGVPNEQIDALNKMEHLPSRVLNQLEAFAMFFVNGVAADAPAFLTVGSLYCDVVRKLFPLVAILSDDDPSYEHLKKLYFLWQSRRERFRLLADRARLERVLHFNEGETGA